MRSLEVVGDATEEWNWLVVALDVTAEKEKNFDFKHGGTTLYFVSLCCSRRFHQGACSA